MGKAVLPLSCPPGDILGSSHPSTVWVSWVLDHTLPQAHISASSLPPPTLPSSAFSFPPPIASLELFFFFFFSFYFIFRLYITVLVLPNNCLFVSTTLSRFGLCWEGGVCQPWITCLPSDCQGLREKKKEPPLGFCSSRLRQQYYR